MSSETAVVLLTGLPGDSASESLFQEQLQTWLELVVRARVHQCLVFCNQPGAADSISQVPLRVEQGDRRHFLACASKLAPGLGAITVVVWGHGGRQESTPVFHVRGPRLTPEDFATVAAGFPPVPSHWVLMFRGSGSFARALKGRGRVILSSEDTTMFSSDPAGLPLLLKLVQKQPGWPLSSLGRDLGRATSEWYSQRQLALTEEPTLWLPETPPRHLVAEAMVPAAPSRAAGLPALSADGLPNSNGQPSRAESSVAGPGVDWSRIQKVQPRDYPEADAVVLSSRQLWVVGDDPALLAEREQFVQILRPAGKRFGDINLAFSPPDEELELLSCEVLRPDGRFVRMEPEAAGVVGEPSPTQYQPMRREFFSLPGVVPGAILHVRYRSQWRRYPLPHVSLDVPIGGELPTVDSTLEIRLPKDQPFHFAFGGTKASDPQVDQTSYSTSYRWHFRDLPPHRPEPLSAPARAPGLSISTFKDWAEFATWYSHLSKLADELSPEIVSKARELTRGAGTARDKVKLLYEYVNGLRYVAVPLGVNSVRPHAAANVLRNQFGDCKDKANLLNALLHALGIDADLVLVPRFRAADPALPGFAFNHAISRVVLGSETLWLDPTDEVCRFGLLPPGEAGHHVLVMDGRSSSLTRLPKPDPGRHRLVMRAKIGCPAADALCPLQVDATGTGFIDYEFRQAARAAQDRPVGFGALLDAGYRPAAGTVTWTHQDATPVSALSRDFEWHGQGQCVGEAYQANGECTFHSPFWLPKEWETALAARHAPLFLNQGYPLKVQEEFQIQLPAGATHPSLPPDSANAGDPLRWQVGWHQSADGCVTGVLNAELVQGDLSQAQTAGFQAQLRGLRGALAADVRVTLLSPNSTVPNSRK